MNVDIIVIGAGAGGVFTAINIAEKMPDKRIVILEKNKEALNKVRISGGGRCNVTNGEKNIDELVKNYPRGRRELRSPFSRFASEQTRTWFEQRGVSLKIEQDGRVFPESDSSQTIIDCFFKLLKKNKIEILYKQNVIDASYSEENGWEIKTQTDVFFAKRMIIATGSGFKMWELLAKLGHTIVPPVPSLFSFNTQDDFRKGLEGTAQNVKVSLLTPNGFPLKNRSKLRLDDGGMVTPLLVTHWGFSGPAILRLSAWGARILSEMNYTAILVVDWLSGEYSEKEIETICIETKLNNSKKQIVNYSPFQFSKKLWMKLLEKSQIDTKKLWADISKIEIQNLVKTLLKSEFLIEGKSTFKEEFVTAGGVSLCEVNFKNFKSKVLPEVYFTGEVLDIDAITGGFNFQNAWTGGYIIAESILKEEKGN